jgi:double-strand break repair protein MRE11
VQGRQQDDEDAADSMAEDVSMGGVASDSDAPPPPKAKRAPAKAPAKKAPAKAPAKKAPARGKKKVVTVSYAVEVRACAEARRSRKRTRTTRWKRSR